MTDSAGVPFAGRAFHANQSAQDDGSAPPAVMAAIAGFRSGGLGIADVVVALHGERLLVPLVAVRGDDGVGAHGQLVDKTQELSIVTVAGPDGRAVLPAFTSADAMRAWDPLARPIPIEASRIALASAQEGTQLIIIDPASPTEIGIRRPAFRALATGDVWVPALEDPGVLEAFRAPTAGEPKVQGLRLVAGDPDARLVAPEVVVLLTVVEGLERNELDALIARVGAAWAGDPTILDRVDSLTVRIDSVPG